MEPTLISEIGELILKNEVCQERLRRIQEIDRAWNDRRWGDYASFLADAFEGWSSDETVPHGKAEHVRRAEAFCAAAPGARMEIKPYLALFACAERDRTFSAARLTGFAVTEGKPALQPLNSTFCSVCEWESGRIVRQWRHVARGALV